MKYIKTERKKDTNTERKAGRNKEMNNERKTAQVFRLGRFSVASTTRKRGSVRFSAEGAHRTPCVACINLYLQSM
jgi:hypothetical protein